MMKNISLYEKLSYLINWAQGFKYNDDLQHNILISVK